MKKLLAVLLTLYYLFPLFSQNPIVRETHFEQQDNQWNKVFMVERTFDNQGILTTEQQLYFETAIEQWVPQNSKWFDRAGNEVRENRQYFAGIDLGFFVQDIRRTFDKNNQILTEEFFQKEDKNSQLMLTNRNEWEYLPDCSTIKRIYYRNQATKGELSFQGIQFTLFDENCEYVYLVSNNRDVPVERLRNQIRLRFESLEDDKERRIVETLACANEFGCEEWAFKEQKTFDADGQLLSFITGSREGFSRSITNFEYQPTQTTTIFQRFARLNNLANQSLVSRIIAVTDTSGQLLSRQIHEPFSFSETINEYDEKGLITQTFFENRQKDSTGIKTFRDTTDYRYQYYCDGLMQSQIVDYGGFKTKIEYSYLLPADCGESTPELLPFGLFPNPANNLLNLVSEQFVNGAFSFSIIDAYGKVIHQQQNYRDNNQVIDISPFSNGVYFLQLNNQDKVATKSFIIAR